MINRYSPVVGEVKATAYCAANPDGQYVLASDHEREVAALRARCEAAERDARRYRWLRARINWSEQRIGVASNRTAPVIETHVRYWTHVDMRQNRPSHEHIDEYIDAAMEGQP